MQVFVLVYIIIVGSLLQVGKYESTKTVGNTYGLFLIFYYQSVKFMVLFSVYLSFAGCSQLLTIIYLLDRWQIDTHSTSLHKNE